MEIPCRRRRERLCLVVIIKSGETVPRRISTEQFHRTRFQHQSKDQKTKKPNGHPRWRICICRTRSPRREQNCGEARLQKQRIPLEGEERLAGGINRKI